MRFVQGNYKGQANHSFPLDCDSLESIQTNNYMSQIIGNICDSSCVILSGCGLDGTASGYVFVKSSAHPEGEVLDYEPSGSVATRVYIHRRNITVSSNNVNYQEAYTERWASPVDDGSVVDESFDWNEFVLGKNCGSLIGEIKIWSGAINKIPDGYLLCDGMDYDISAYPHLNRVIGSDYNTQYKPSDGAETYPNPDANKFRVPDLRTRFVVGCMESNSDSGNDYYMKKQGGKNSVTLSGNESGVGSHTHTNTHSHGVGSYNVFGTFPADDSMLGIDDYSPENQRNQTERYNFQPTGAFTAVPADQTINGPWLDIDSDAASLPEGGRLKLDARMGHGFSGESGNTTITTDEMVEPIGASQAHENRPRYYAMAYIIRAR